MKLTNNKTKSLKLSKQALGTLNKVISMVEEDTYCPEVIQQIESVIGMLNSAKKEMLMGHLDNCLEERLKQDKNKTIQELLKIFQLSI
ncbi:MAG: metal-sensitive transcriptional regulator [Candidatus Roizmanbacteria bacterium]